MKKFLETLTKILLLNFIFLFLMALSRVAFCFYYGRGILSNDLTVDILKAFGMGARFDLSVLAYINLPVTITLIVLFFIGQKRYYDVFLMILKYYYTIIMGGVFVFLSIDFGFYSYFQNHLNILAFGFLEDDTQALLSTFSQNYNLRLIIFCFILEFIIVYFISRKILKRREISYMFDRRLGIGGKIVIAVLVLAINALLARGSVGTFPLEVDMTGMAEVSKNPFINKVAVNGFYTLQAAMAARSKEKINLDFVEETGYGGNIRQAFADYLGKDISEIPFDDPQNSLEVVLPFDKTIESIRPNVIFIVMESLGSSLLKYDSPDFNLLGELRQHFQEDIVFYNFLPAGDGTMVSLEGIVTNLARRPGGIVLSQTQYAHKKSAFGAAVPYKQKGYETLFIYGGGTGWRNLDVFLENLGFDQVIGQAQMDENYPKNQWGVYDEYLFDYVFKVLTDDNKRKFIGVLSTTNHPPFTLPKDYKSLPLNPPAALRDRTLDKELAALRYEAYQYANRALANFIAKVKRSPYANNTIIVVTGDHSFWSLFENTNEELLDRIAVPFYLYIPPALRPKDFDEKAWGSHLDIMPTLYRLSLSNARFFAMGNDIFSKRDNIAYNDSGILADKEAVVDDNLFSQKTAYYIYGLPNRFGPSMILPSALTSNHRRLIKYYLPMIAISDYLIKGGAQHNQNNKRANAGGLNLYTKVAQ